eukprot:3894699-Prymnesium_polylepis.1
MQSRAPTGLTEDRVRVQLQTVARRGGGAYLAGGGREIFCVCVVGLRVRCRAACRAHVRGWAC